ncbi:uncharacterized protein TNCV_1484211 [Trichonephila clavipes]|nr:uncharacterized protein TNCV_1484211 [Trichonephila clavipes]
MEDDTVWENGEASTNSKVGCNNGGDESFSKHDTDDKTTRGLFFDMPATIRYLDHWATAARPFLRDLAVAMVAEWSRYRIVAGFVMSLSPVPLKTRHVRERCMLNLSRAQTSSRWCGVVVRRGGASLGVIHVT